MAGNHGEDQESEVVYSVVYLPEAEADILETFQYYEDKAEGLGFDFVRAVEVCLASVARFPKMYQTVYKDKRRAMIRRFPYHIIYVIVDEEIVVQSCVHSSRDPQSWQRRG